MANLSSFPGNHEIIEIEEELNPGEQNRSNNYMKPELKREEIDRISSLEEDLNQLFEIFNRRSSSNGLAHTNQAGTTSKKSASKKLVKAGGPHSPGHGISERVNLKQALRGLCLSQKSEMAAMKRSAKTPGSSEAGKIMTLYRNVVDEDCMSNHSQDDGRGGLLEISLVPEESTFDSFRNKHTQWSPTKLGSDSFRNTPKNLPVPDMWPSNRSSLADRVKPNTTPNETVFESRLEKPVSVTSSPSPYVDDNVADMDHSLLNQSRMIRASAEVGNQASVTEMRQKQKHPLLLPSSSPTTATQWSPTKVGSATVKNGTREIAKSSMTKNGEFPLSTEFASQTSLTDSLQKEKCMSPSASHPNYSEPSFEFARKMPVQKEMISVGSGSQMTKVSLEMIPTSVGSGNQTKVEMLLHEDELEPACSPCTGKQDKIEPEESALRAVKKDSSKILPPTGSPKGKKVNKSMKNSYHFVKPLIKTKNFVKRKSKKISSDNNSSKNKRSEFNNDLYSSPNPVVCPNCQCVVTDAWKEANQESQVSHQGSLGSDQESPVSLHESLVSYQDSPVSPFASFSAEVSSGNVISDVSTPGPSSESLNKKSKEVVVAEARGNSKTRVKGEFTQSSKDSPGECSTSTSEESIISRPSFCDRPHMSKDVRWEAIRCVRFQHGTIGLRNFNLLKKLGCGDIGTVYLAELIGTNCHFAIKVMDNEFLVRRKKIARAQTEREILRMLDHPFLPTLYCQFISDNLSCLVMEYCPGGDLHVLRQRQPGRCFTEQAARFYLAEVLLALEYLHMLGVIYRDLKPENILVREDGHIMLSDFDLSLRCVVSPTLLVSSSMSETSKKVSRPSSDSRCVQPLCIEPSCEVTCFTPRLLATSSKLRKQKSDVAAEMRPLLQLVAEPTTARSNSFVGTHEYLAPEIIKGEGHGSAVDWWTFGIFLYELLYGRTPFKGAGNEETLANVVLQSLKFPDSPLVSLQARDLITALLVKEPENRLGTERGAAEIKQHPFFDGLNWALIRCAVPPELPEHRSYGLPQVGTGSGEHLEFEVF